MVATLGRVINDYESLIEVCRQRAAELAISREGIDLLSGCAPGLAGKILGHRQAKKLGPTTLKPILQVLGLKLLVIEDDHETALTLAVREPVHARQQRFGGPIGETHRSCWKRQSGLLVRRRCRSFVTDKNAASRSTAEKAAPLLPVEQEGGGIHTPSIQQGTLLNSESVRSGFGLLEGRIVKLFGLFEVGVA
jgi:hypothetical protein